MEKTLHAQNVGAAAKILGDPHTSAREKAAAGRKLAARRNQIRTVKSLPVSGSIPKAAIRRAVKQAGTQS